MTTEPSDLKPQIIALVVQGTICTNRKGTLYLSTADKMRTDWLDMRHIICVNSITVTWLQTGRLPHICSDKDTDYNSEYTDTESPANLPFT
jgi:hypothetical protein